MEYSQKLWSKVVLVLNGGFGTLGKKLILCEPASSSFPCG